MVPEGLSAAARPDAQSLAGCRGLSE